MPNTAIAAIERSLNTFLEDFLNLYTHNQGSNLLNKLKAINPNFDLDSLKITNAAYNDLNEFLHLPSAENDEKLLDKLRELNPDLDALIDIIRIKKPTAYTALEELLIQSAVGDSQSLSNKLKEINPDFNLDDLRMTIYAYELVLAMVSQFNIQNASKLIFDQMINEVRKDISQAMTEILNNELKNDKQLSKASLSKSHQKKLNVKYKKLNIDIADAIMRKKPEIEMKSEFQAFSIRNKKINEILIKLLDELKPIFTAAIILVFETKQIQIIAKWKELILKAASTSVEKDLLPTSDIHFTRAIAMLRSGEELNKEVEIFPGQSLELQQYFETYLIRVLFTSHTIEELLDESLRAILKCFILPYPELIEILESNVHIYATSPEHVVPPHEFWHQVELIRTNENNNGIMQTLLMKFKEHCADDKELKLILTKWVSEDIKNEDARKVNLSSARWKQCRQATGNIQRPLTSCGHFKRPLAQSSGAISASTTNQQEKPLVPAKVTLTYP